jgi:hypothetical protein
MTEQEELRQLRHMRAMMVDAYVRYNQANLRRGEKTYVYAPLIKSLLWFGPSYPGDEYVDGLSKKDGE